MNQTEQDRQFIQRLSTWWKENSKGIQAVAAGKLAPGIICVADRHQDAANRSQKEIDIFFDLERYRFQREELWENSKTVASGLKKAGLGYLPGVGCVPRMRTPDDAYKVALLEIASHDGQQIGWGKFRLAEKFQRKLLSV